MVKPKDRNKVIVKFIIEFTKTNGYPPTMRETAKQIGVSSSATIHKILHECQDEGFIEIPKGVLRGMKATQEGKKFIKS